MGRHNADLLAYHDLDGRSGFKLALQEVDGRFFLYVAGFWHSGWSILEVTDPEHPELLRWLPGPPGTMTLQVQVAGGTMITALEHPPPGLRIGDAAAPPQDGFLIWEVREPGRPRLLGRRVSGGTGTHRNFYNGGPQVCAASNLPGFEGQIPGLVDIAGPATPKMAGTWWHPGQHTAAGETPAGQRRLSAGRPYPQHGLSLHGGAYALGDRACCPWMRGGMVIPDITGKHHPAHVSTLPVYPPLGSAIAVHSAVPLPGRDVVVINNEALREDCDEPAGYVATVDISDESDPIVMAIFPRPARRAGTTRRAFAPRAAGPGRTTSTSSRAWTAWRPTTGSPASPTSAPACRSTTSATPATRTSPGTTSPTTPNSAAARYRPGSSTRPEDVLAGRRGVICMSEGNSGIYILTHHPS
jgi:hypothetical protein